MGIVHRVAANDSDVVPWSAADDRTILLARIDFALLTTDSVFEALTQMLSPGHGAAEKVSQWVGRLKESGVREIVIGLGAPFDDDGEESDPPTWIALRHPQGAGDGDQRLIESLVGERFIGPLDSRREGEWTILTQAGAPALRKPIEEQQRRQLSNAISNARGGGLTVALVMPEAMRGSVAHTLGDFAELYADPVRSMLRRLSSAVTHTRELTGGIWFGSHPTVRIEWSFNDPSGPRELTLALGHAREMAQRSAESGPEDDAGEIRREGWRAVKQLLEIRHADGVVVWQVEPQQIHLIQGIFAWLAPPKTGI